ncbi:protein-tyrosine phosphatase family protein [Hymenobacter glaciei]|uniref:Protein-tyrosine phosphatase family protein n=1 Tax=Hymenobacter glaciei TaxID=877209 RepID=A0ABP7UN47_9BACT
MNTTPTPRPLPNSYWATPLLLASEYPGARDANEAAHRLDLLLAAGIRDFYDLTEANEGLEPYEDLLRARAEHLGLAAESVRFRRFPIRNVSVPTPKRLNEVLTALEDSTAAGRRAVVHCWGGIGRTGTVVGCHLRQHFGLSGDEALARIAEEWTTVEKNQRAPQSPETDEQAAFISAFEPVPVPVG